MAYGVRTVFINLYGQDGQIDNVMAGPRSCVCTCAQRAKWYKKCKIILHNLQNMRFLHRWDTTNTNNERFGLQNRVKGLYIMRQMRFLRIVLWYWYGLGNSRHLLFW